jgi:predicted Rossmann fold nucleotide-binding protein DprA/Smf involved in DNA uptake
MSPDKQMTINDMKQKRTVPEAVKESSKEFRNVKKTILKALETGPKSIPQIASETGYPLPHITFNLMSLRKYGDIEVTEEITEDDYYLYKRKD